MCGVKSKGVESREKEESIIGADGLNGRVRDGIECGPVAGNTRTLYPTRISVSEL